MNKKSKKSFPSGTFIPTPKRLCAIIQLCLAFSLFLWYAAQPFMGEHFTLRSRMLLYEYVMGTSPLLPPQSQEKLERNKERFRSLDQMEQGKILNDYQHIQKKASRSLFTKIAEGIKVVFLNIPSFELAWIVFAVLIAILVLLRTEGASLAAWLLPCIALVYGVDNRINGDSIPPSPDQALFPSEESLLVDYIKQPLASNWRHQQEQLLQGWQHYLVQHWSGLNGLREEQKEWNRAIEEGEFNFTLARLNILGQQPESQWFNSFHKKESLYNLILYIGWNLLFAWIINRAPRPLKKLYQKTKIPIVIEG